MSEDLQSRCAKALEERADAGLERCVQLASRDDGILNLANNDYFRLSRHLELKKIAKDAVDRFGLSSSASPLITGFGEAHEMLLEKAKSWHGFEYGTVWNTGYAANQALLSKLPEKGDVVLADRLIHNSMISGILQSGARLVRYRHCDVDHLALLLDRFASKGRQVFVVTESVFSMDGDYPDLAKMAELKKRHSFFWVVDEAHALGWYGEKGSGLLEQAEVGDDVDALVGTLGKALGSMGAYTLFHDSVYERYLQNFAGEFIYSTYLSPIAAAVGAAAMDILKDSHSERRHAQTLSSRIRVELRTLGFDVPTGESPIVPIRIGGIEETLAAAATLKEAGILVGAIRPPTVPENESRLRLSLNSDLGESELERVFGVFRELRRLR